MVRYGMVGYGTVEYGMVWYGMVRYGMVWLGVVWCGVVWCGVVWCGVVWCDAVRCGVLCCAVLCCAVLCCAVLCCGMVWYGMIWHGMVWYVHVAGRTYLYSPRIDCFVFIFPLMQKKRYKLRSMHASGGGGSGVLKEGAPAPVKRGPGGGKAVHGGGGDEREVGVCDNVLDVI